MNMRRNYILLVWLIAIVVFYETKISNAEESTAQVTQDDLYEKAMSLKEEGKSDAAMDMLKKFMDANSNDELKYTDALLEQCVIMKDINNPTWKLKTIEAQQKIKILYRINYNKPEYWLAYAKFAALVGRESHLSGAFKKAFFYKPNYTEGYITKGDLYSYFARNTSPAAPVPYSSTTGKTTNTIRTRGKENSSRYVRGEKARDAYYVALNSMRLDNKKKAYVFYRIGELELLLFSNKSEAVRNWKKVVELDPDSIYGKRSKERLEIHE